MIYSNKEKPLVSERVDVYIYTPRVKVGSKKTKPRGHFFVLNIPLSFFTPLKIDIVTSRIVITISNFFSFT